MSIERRNNHGANPWPNEDDRAVEQAFLRLGDVLAEIAGNPEQRKQSHAKPEKATSEGKDKQFRHERTIDLTHTMPHIVCDQEGKQ